MMELSCTRFSQDGRCGQPAAELLLLRNPDSEFPVRIGVLVRCKDHPASIEAESFEAVGFEHRIVKITEPDDASRPG